MSLWKEARPHDSLQATSAGTVPLPSLNVDPNPKTDSCKAEGRALLCTFLGVDLPPSGFALVSKGLEPSPRHQCSFGTNLAMLQIQERRESRNLPLSGQRVQQRRAYGAQSTWICKRLAPLRVVTVT